MRKLATLAGAFALGIFLAQYLLPYGWLLPCAGVAFLLACGRLFLRGNAGRRVLLVGVGLSLALGYDWLYVRQVQQPMEALAGEEMTVEMTVCDTPVLTDYGAKVTVELAGFFAGKAVYYGEDSLLDLMPGQTISDLVSLQSAARIQDDDITTFTSKGVFLLAYQRETPVYGPGSADSPRWWPVRLAQAMRARIAALFEGDAAGFLTAILTGDKSGLSETASSDLSEAGLYHILAVSGMHCGFLLTLVVLLTGRHRRRLLAGVTVPLLAFYTLLTGGSPSVVRACVMLGFLLAAPLFRRESDPPTALTAALLVILLKNPFAAASVSLQLSFGAMAGILFLTPKLHQTLIGSGKHGKVFHFIATGFSTTMGALVFTTPLSAWYFGTLVLVAPVSNLLCLWAASLIFLLGLLAVAAGFLWLPLGTLLGLAPRALIWYVLRAARLLTKLPYHALYFTDPYLKYWLAYLYLLFGAAWLLRPRIRRKYAVAAVLAAASLIVTVRLGRSYFTGGALNVLVLDVGQGESVLLSSEGMYALVDCGSRNSWYDAGDIAAEHLSTMGSWKLDYLILTHYDADHVSGVEELLSRVRVGALLLPDTVDDAGQQSYVLAAAEANGVPIVYLREADSFSLGSASLTVYPPLGDGGDNEQGLTVLASQGDYDLLITGDMDSATEKKLLASYALPDIEALVVGHHGSKYSTSAELLEALRPELGLISVGTNSYGHPADETLRRLVEADVTVYRTDLQGRIYLSID